MSTTLKIISISVVAGLGACLLLFPWHISSPRVIARAVAPNGIELCVVQECNWSTEPFTTSVLYRKPGGAWGWFYYDHEDLYWRKGHTEIDPQQKRITVFRGGKATASFEWETETLVRYWPDVPPRKIRGAQKWMPPGWRLTHSVYTNP
ncbi:MAG TPA: hypothetical protein HPP77_05795 [Candidatus Hydrogenedentes bacterium]|nr:hypothetical protein [Candidatus Hydrogenedentota bacterium]